MELSPPPEPFAVEDPKGGVVFAAMLGLVLFLIAFPTAARQAQWGILWSGSGLLMMLFPPKVRLPRTWVVCALGFVIFASAGFLPSAWFQAPEWRTRLEQAGLDTGKQAFVQVRMAADALAGFVATAAIALFMLGHRIGNRTHLRLACVFCGLVSVVIGLAVARHKPGEVFGFFPNRNHTATLLAMLLMVAWGCLFQAVRKRNLPAGFVSAVVVSLSSYALVVISESRAGILLAAVGLGLWFAFTGIGRIRGNAAIVLGLFLFAAAGLFLMVESRVKERVIESAGMVSRFVGDELTRGEGETPSASITNLDGRFSVYLDAVRMLESEPWVGVGPGQFDAVFPQYREKTYASLETVCLHPESDWLQMILETGWPAVAFLATGVALVFVAAFRQARSGSSRGLRMASLVAAFLLCLHGIIDVPGHRIGLALGAAWLLALGFRGHAALPAPRGELWICRLAGTVILCGGFALLIAHGSGKPLLATESAVKRMNEMQTLYEADQAAYEAAVASGRKYQPAKDQDPLIQALDRVDEAIRLGPLQPHPHHIRGVLALHFKDKLAEAERSFSIQRELAPGRVRPLLAQASAWQRRGPARTGELWRMALENARKDEAHDPFTKVKPREIYIAMLREAGMDDDLLAAARFAAEGDTILLNDWSRAADQKQRQIEGLRRAGEARSGKAGSAAAKVEAAPSNPDDTTGAR